jgi:hypothetical protein
MDVQHAAKVITVFQEEDEVLNEVCTFILYKIPRKILVLYESFTDRT